MLTATAISFSCSRYELYKAERRPKLHFVNTTDGPMVLEAGVRDSNSTSFMPEGSWFNIPQEQLDLTKPIKAYRKDHPDSVFFSQQINPRHAEDTIVIGRQDFLKEIIVYTDNKPDTLGGTLYYRWDTNYDQLWYTKSFFSKGDSFYESLEVPGYVFKGKKARMNYNLVRVGIVRWDYKENITYDTIPYAGIEKLRIRFKAMPEQN